MKRHNAGLPENEQAGFYGLDVYSLWESLKAILDYLERVDPDAAITARRAFRCFEPFGENVEEYARATLFVPMSCEREVVELLTELRRNADVYSQDREGYFNAEQNAQVVRDAERYYRTMVIGGAASWNVRDVHMVSTLERLFEHHGPQAKAIVWAHNTHVGDARATDMARAGMVNIGQVVRERHPQEGVVLIGYGGHHGTVIAGREWGAEMERMVLPPAREGSWEDLLHRVNTDNKLLILDPDGRPLRERRGQRAVGVVYDPDMERVSNYVPTALSQRYDSLISLDDTRALHPLHVTPQIDGEPPATYPWTF
jgi:erythromycin esterase-like protein